MSRKHVLFINTNRMRPVVAPLAWDYIGAALQAEGWRVKTLDLCWTEDSAAEMANVLGAERPQAVAITFRNTDDCYYASGRSFVDLLRDDIQRVGNAYDGPIVVGGCGFSTMPELILDRVGAEFGVRGDGEIALLRFLEAIEGNGTLAEVPGLIYRSGGAWRDNGLAVSDLSAFDLSARDVVDNRRYFATGGQAGIETKRGCPHECIYCAEPVVKGRTSRLRAPAEIVREVRRLLAQGIDCFHTCDSEFNVPLSHAVAVCEALIDAGLGDQVYWYAYAAPFPFPPELGALMRRAGCVGINFGVDSGCDPILKILQRSFDSACLESTADTCRQYGIAFMYDLLLGGAR